MKNSPLKQINNYIVAPILDKAVFDYNHENKARSEYPNVINHSSPLNIRSTKASQIFRGVTSHETGQVVGPKQMMGVKKHRSMVISLPKPGTVFKPRRGSSPVITLYRKYSKGNINDTGRYNTCSSPTKHKRSNSTISAAGAGIRQALINIGKFLQAAQYIITLTLVFSIAWLPLAIVVFADTMTRNFNEGFHKVER